MLINTKINLINLNENKKLNRQDWVAFMSQPYWVEVNIEAVLGSTHVVEQLSFSMFPSILTFDFDLIFGLFWLFEALLGYFVFNVGLKNCFGVHSCSLATFIFYDYLNYDIWIWINFGVVFVFFGARMGWLWGWSKVW